MNKTSMKNLNNGFAILVLSCDKYSDLWKPFFYQFWKLWPDCPYKLYLGSNTKKYEEGSVQTILSGKDKDWSSSLLRILDKIHYRYIFLWLDDFFLISSPDNSQFTDILHFMNRNNAKSVRIAPSPKPDKIIEHNKYGQYGKDAPYRVTTFGFWEVETLKRLLIPGENPWNFEIMGSYRSSYEDGFFCRMKPLFQTLNVIEKGQIFKEIYDYCNIHSIPLSKMKWPVSAQTFYLKSEIQKFYFSIVIRIPWKIRLSIMNILRKLLISY